MATKTRPAGGYMARAMQAVEVSRATKIAAIAQEPAGQQQAPEPIRIIRKVNGMHQWVTLRSESALTEAERREIYCNVSGIYA